ncbi:MAG TPA: DUF302 domain-containing protein [Acidimicrobiales bacterium]|nr:DUF302 domain-containing protein [Acidimicrobiales bacterium]
MEPTLHFTQRVVTSLGYEAAIDAIKDALQGQGFGTLTEIDVRSTLKAKLDVDTAPQLIIGACNPHLAHRALTADPRVATLLPCNVVVRVEGDQTVVEALDPQVMAEVSGDPQLRQVAEEAARRIATALDTLPRH